MPDQEQKQRQTWHAVLAKAPIADIEAAVACLGDVPSCTLLRHPETGLVMARARAGGSGQRFNLGEIPVTRCSVQSPAGHIGHGYVQGRDKRHAELVATLDALLQDEARRPRLERDVIEPLAAAAAERQRAVARKAAATRVDFFTLVRGEG